MSATADLTTGPWECVRCQRREGYSVRRASTNPKLRHELAHVYSSAADAAAMAAAYQLLQAGRQALRHLDPTSGAAAELRAAIDAATPQPYDRIPNREENPA